MAGAKGGHPVLHRAPDRVIMEGSFICNGASAPTTVRGDGFTIGAPATGLYTGTISDGKYAGCDAAQAWINQASGGNDTAFIEGVVDTDVQSGTFQIQTQSAAGTDADLSAPVEVHFRLCLRNTAVTRRSGA